jgi:CheY-like chemotaxis protein
MQGDEQKAQSAGCDGYITKPIDIRTLASMVSRFLKEHGRRDGFPSGGALTNPGQGQLAEANRPAPAIESAELLPGDGLRPPASGDSGDLLSELRNNLLAQGMYEIPKLLASLETEFNADKARRFFHRWAGIAGTLGCPEITVQSRKLEELLT